MPRDAVVAHYFGGHKLRIGKKSVVGIHYIRNANNVYTPSG